jgi:hypothetical protein
MPLIPWAVGLTASRPSENGTSMTSPLHSDPSWHSVFPQSPKKIQENLKQTGATHRNQQCVGLHLVSFAKAASSSLALLVHPQRL